MTDLAVEVARQYVTDVQAKVADVQKKIEKLDFEPKSQQAKLEAKLADLQAEAKKAQARFEAQVAEIQGDAKAFPAKAQSFVADTLAEVAETYADRRDRALHRVRGVGDGGVGALGRQQQRHRQTDQRRAPDTTARRPRDGTS